MVFTIDSELTPFLPLNEGDGIVPGSRDWVEVGKPKTLLDLISLIKKNDLLSCTAARLLATLCKSHEFIASISVPYIIECLQLSPKNQIVAHDAPEDRTTVSWVSEYLYDAIRSYPENMYLRLAKLVADEGKNILNIETAHTCAPLLNAAWRAEQRFRAALNNHLSPLPYREWTHIARKGFVENAFRFIANCLRNPRLVGDKNIREAINQKSILLSEGFPVPIVKEDLSELSRKIKQLRKSVSRHPTLIYLLNLSEKEMEVLIRRLEDSFSNGLCDDIGYGERFSRAWCITLRIEEAPYDLPITPINIEPFESIQDLKKRLPQLMTSVRNEYDKELVFELERIIEQIELIDKMKEENNVVISNNIRRLSPNLNDDLEKILNVLSNGEVV